MNTTTTTETYSTTDVQNVVRRFQTDLKMIGDSSGALTTEEVNKYVHDVELLATKGYLASVDVTLLNFGIEVRAARYTVDTDAGGLVSSRPGNALWPRVTFPKIRIILFYTTAYDAEARQALSGKMSFSWTTTTEDTTHSSLKEDGGRNYTSGSYGLKREDWSK
jgi:hypothetical protein